MKTLLIYPPFADPTQSYISLPVLKGYLEDKGFDAKIRDFNIEGVRYLFEKDNLDRLTADVAAAFEKLDAQNTLSMFEQIRYKSLFNALQKNVKTPVQNCGVLDLFRSEDLFYDHEAYSAAVDSVEHVFDQINALSFPFRFGFNQAGHFTLPWSVSMLRSYVIHRQSPLMEFYDAQTESGAFDAVSLAGISLTFVSQIPEAFTIAHSIKKRNPSCLVIIGGMCMSQIARSMSTEALGCVFGFTDYLCTGDGEETLAGLMTAIEAGNGNDTESLRQIPNIVFPASGKAEPVFGDEKSFDIRSSPPPDFSDLDLDSYLAPERLLLYSPTRRCYWKKCSFCTYGMSFSKEYAYREIPPEKAATDLAFLCEKYGVKNFYFSCDVLSPAYAKRIAQEISSIGLCVRWSSDLRIESAYTEELCAALYESGMRSVAFGVESGSDHMLGLMKKGITQSMIRSVNRIFHEVGIATQWMTFTYHPGETPALADKTLRLIGKETDSIALFIVGEFQLAPGSIIANDPGAYGISRVFFTRGDELRLYPLFSLENPEASSIEDRERIDSRIDELASSFVLRAYPWAGAISTHHSFLYFLKFGQGAFRRLAKESGRRISRKKEHIRNNGIEPRFSIPQIDENTERLYSGIYKALEPARGPDAEYEAELSEEYLDRIAKKIKPLHLMG